MLVVKKLERLLVDCGVTYLDPRQQSKPFGALHKVGGSCLDTHDKATALAKRKLFAQAEEERRFSRSG